MRARRTVTLMANEPRPEARGLDLKVNRIGLGLLVAFLAFGATQSPPFALLAGIVVYAIVSAIVGRRPQPGRDVNR